MQEIVTFLKSLLSRKFLLALAAFIATNIAKIPPKYQYLVPVANFAVVAIYAYANVQEKKVTNGTTLVVSDNVIPPAPELPSTVDPEQPLEDVPPAP